MAVKICGRFYCLLSIFPLFSFCALNMETEIPGCDFSGDPRHPMRCAAGNLGRLAS